MKKLFTLLLVAFTCIQSHAKDKYVIDIGIGGGQGSVAGEKTGLFCMSVSLFNVYFEFATNFDRGKGEYLNFSSSQSYQIDEIAMDAFAFGYNINLYKKRIYLLPKVGFTTSYAIYNDPILWDTWYKQKLKGRWYIGGALKFFLHKNVGVSINSCSTVPISAQVHFRF